MLDLNDFRFFVEIVDRGGFSAAGRSLRRPTSTVSYRIRQLERELGLTLLARTSRTVVMTEAGREFYGYATAVVDQADEAEGVMRERSHEPTGTVHFSAGLGVAQFAMPIMLASFMAKYPGVKLIQHVSSQHVDVVADRFDFAIRTHCKALPDSQLVQRPLVKDVPWHLFASPAYLENVGPFRTPKDLDRAETLFMRGDSVEPAWRLTADDDRDVVVEIPLQPRILSVCMATLKGAAEAGQGIVALPAYICREEIRSGRLVRVLSGWTAARSWITALMPHRRGMTAAARSFIDHIAGAFPAAVSFDADWTPGIVSTLDETLVTDTTEAVNAVIS